MDNLQRTAAALVSADEMLAMDVYHSKQHNTLSAWCMVDDSFAGLRVGRGVNMAFSSAWVDVYPDRVEVFTRTFDPVLVVTLHHSLTIRGTLGVTLQVGRTNQVRIRLVTSTGTYESPLVEIRGCGTQAYMQPLGCSVENAILTYADNDKKKDIWLFGDSYMDMYPKYLIGYGYGHFAEDGHSGRTSQAALASLKHALKYHAAPKLLIWALGMNDADEDDAINPNWLAVSEELLVLCREHGITPILCTTPNTPTRSNAHKNAYVYQSGCRICDIASAVHAPGERNWYPNMLRGDDVHPTELGSQAIAHKMICDIPELQDCQ